MHERTVRRIVEAHLQARRRVLAHEDKVRVLLDQCSEVRCHGAGGIDLALVPGGTVVGPAEEELERVCATAALEGEIREVPDLGESTTSSVSPFRVSGAAAVSSLWKR